MKQTDTKLLLDITVLPLSFCITSVIAWAIFNWFLSDKLPAMAMVSFFLYIAFDGFLDIYYSRNKKPIHLS